MQRIYIRVYITDTLTPHLYTDLNDALSHHWPAELQYFDMKDDEAFYHVSKYLFWYHVNKSGELKYYDCWKSFGCDFVWKKTDDIDKMSKKELMKKTEAFKKRLCKFDDMGYVKHKLEIKIKSLQNELDKLNWKN